jgi:hypothetical protein
VELSESGVRWTTLHFCCRFDAPCCLDYFLKKCFLQGAHQYPFFVNQQTIEGLTCLHLCGIWSAYRCSVLLLRYGGLNLALHDKRHKTAEAVMGEYGLREMKHLLAEIKAKEGCVTEWHFALLLTVPDVATMRETQFYDDEIAKIEHRLHRATEPPRETETFADEARLREEKGKLEQEKEEIHCELMLKEKQADKQQKLKNEANTNGQEEVEKSKDIE